jgi:uracil phosphoribosyltransferase
MEGVTVVDHPLVQHKLTLIRDKNRSTKSFRELLKEIGMLLCYEVTRDLPLTDVEIETPLARMIAPRIAGKKLVFAPVLRAGMTFAEGMLDLVPAARVAHIGLYREPETFVAIEYFFKAPSDLSERLVIVVAPILATANTAVAAVDRLKERGGRRYGLFASSARLKASSGCVEPIPTYRSGRLQSTNPSTSARSSCPVSATPAIERTGRGNLGEVAELPLPQSRHQTND